MQIQRGQWSVPGAAFDSLVKWYVPCVPCVPLSRCSCLLIVPPWVLSDMPRVFRVSRCPDVLVCLLCRPGYWVICPVCSVCPVVQVFLFAYCAALGIEWYVPCVPRVPCVPVFFVYLLYRPGYWVICPVCSVCPGVLVYLLCRPRYWVICPVCSVVLVYLLWSLSFVITAILFTSRNVPHVLFSEFRFKKFFSYFFLLFNWINRLFSS